MQPEAEKLIRDVRGLIGDAEALIQATAGDWAETTRETRARLAGAVLVTRSACQRLERRLTAPGSAAQDWVRQNVYGCMALAFFGGLAAALLARRR